VDINGLSVGMDVLISVLFGASGAIGVWFKLKGKVEILDVEIGSLKDDLKALTSVKKEDNTALHKRIDTLKIVVEKNREKQDLSSLEIKTEMNKMELRIITAIHELKK
jgi:hypothetical protein